MSFLGSTEVRKEQLVSGKRIEEERRAEILRNFSTELDSQPLSQTDKTSLLSGLNIGTSDLDAQVAARRSRLEEIAGANVSATTAKEELSKRPGRRATILTRNQPLLG